MGGEFEGGNGYGGVDRGTNKALWEELRVFEHVLIGLSAPQFTILFSVEINQLTPWTFQGSGCLFYFHFYPTKPPGYDN